MKKAYLFSLLVLLILWEVTASFFDNVIIFPSIEDTFKAMIDIFSDKDIYLAIFYSIVRTISSVLISFFIALVLAIVAYRYKFFEDFLKPIINLLKTTPTAAVIVIALLVVGRNATALFVAFLIVFPIFYSNILFGFNNIDNNLKLMTMSLGADYITSLKRVYLPLIKNQIEESFLTTTSLAFKVVVMAELLAQVTRGLGHELYFARTNLLTAEVFALSIIMVLISILFDYLIKLISNLHCDRE